MKKRTKSKEGFIVHPNWTNDNKYHASYGNHNKTSKSFNTLRQAKDYIKSKGYNKALYDNSQGNPQTVSTTRTRTKPKKKKFSYFDFNI